MNAIDSMLQDYTIRTHNDRLNAIHEIMQQVTLTGLQRGGFFEKAAFYGGTCLRIFHKLPRFSEDMDFSLLEADKDFKLEPYFPAILRSFEALGQKAELVPDGQNSNICRAFLKHDTSVYSLNLKSSDKRVIKVKIEVDTTPPLQFETENKLLLKPYSCMVRTFTPPCLFAGKMHALLFRGQNGRGWQNRVKGRDWYDFEWYVRHGVPMDFRHFCARVHQFQFPTEAELTEEDFRKRLHDKIAAANIGLIRKDVEPFLRDNSELDIWSNEYFQLLAEQVKLQ